MMWQTAATFCAKRTSESVSASAEEKMLENKNKLFVIGALKALNLSNVLLQCLVLSCTADASMFQQCLMHFLCCQMQKGFSRQRTFSFHH